MYMLHELMNMYIVYWYNCFQGWKKCKDYFIFVSKNTFESILRYCLRKAKYTRLNIRINIY